MTDDLASVRLALGQSAAFWAGTAGVSTEDWGWTALSGASSVDYNVVFCSGGGDAVDVAVARILEARVPAVMMVAGAAMGEVQRLVTRSWVCIGATPVMRLELPGPGAAQSPDPVSDQSRARRLEGAELDAARALVARVFQVGPELAEVALPATADRAPHSVWGAFDEAGTLRSCLGLMAVQESVVVWSMATDSDAQGQGHGRRALTAALAQAAADGAQRSLLYASPMGDPFYRRLGYTVVEHFQMWSRPRWVLGRA